jgi:hypothetical protein
MVNKRIEESFYEGVPIAPKKPRPSVKKPVSPKTPSPEDKKFKPKGFSQKSTKAPEQIKNFLYFEDTATIKINTPMIEAVEAGDTGFNFSNFIFSQGYNARSKLLLNFEYKPDVQQKIRLNKDPWGKNKIALVARYDSDKETLDLIYDLLREYVTKYFQDRYELVLPKSYDWINVKVADKLIVEYDLAMQKVGLFSPNDLNEKIEKEGLVAIVFYPCVYLDNAGKKAGISFRLEGVQF